MQVHGSDSWLRFNTWDSRSSPWHCDHSPKLYPRLSRGNPSKSSLSAGSGRHQQDCKLVDASCILMGFCGNLPAVTAILLGIIAVLLFVVGLFLHACESFDKGVEGGLSWLTQIMGPGVFYKPKKSFPVHIVIYCLSIIVFILSLLCWKMGWRL